MRIGTVPVLDGFGGGIYQYSLTMLRALDQWKDDGCEDEFVLFAEQIDHPVVRSLDVPGWIVKPLQPPESKGEQMLRILGIIVGEGRHREAWRWLRRRMRGEIDRYDPSVIRFRHAMRRWFLRWGIELMIFPSPNRLSFEAGIPYVMAIHDLQHRLQPEFPEVSANGQLELREYIFRNGICRATLVLTDSEVGKEDILNFYGPYGVTPSQVKILPFLPACYLDTNISENERQRIRRSYDLPRGYLFYPAQFWPHKNHARIVQALKLLKQEHHISVHIVFCGAHTGEIRERTFHDVMFLAHQLGIEDQIHYLGFVPEEDMSGLYSEALGLVMPTFFGPSNIPVVEAWSFGCQILTSDIRGIREQVGDAAILVNPRSVEDIAHGIYRILTDDNLRRVLGERAKQRLAAYSPADYRKRLVGILEEAKARISSKRLRSTKRGTSRKEDSSGGV